MQIERLNLIGFGKFAEEEIVLHPGINIIYGKNESGKSTIHTFIKCMLFGLNKSRGRAAKNSDYSLYEPWRNAVYYGGSMIFCCEGRRFFLERNFLKRAEEHTLICLNDREELSISQGDLEMLLGSVSEAVFRNTISISQQGCVTDKALLEEILNFTANYQQSHGSGIQVDEAVLTLKKEQKELELKKNARDEKKRLAAQSYYSEIKYKEEEIEKLKYELHETESKYSSIDGEFKNANYTALKPSVRPQPALVGTAICLTGFMVSLFMLDRWGVFSVFTAALFLLLSILLLFRQYKTSQTLKVPPEKVQSIDHRDTASRLIWQSEQLTARIWEAERNIQNLSQFAEDQLVVSEADIALDQDIEAVRQAVSDIHRLSQSMHLHIRESIDKQAGNILNQITAGKYQEVQLITQTQMRLLQENSWIRLEQVSRGTLEQVHLSLRIAAAEHLCQQEPLPLLLDEPFSQYDRTRILKTLGWLHQNTSQTILFTCHRRETELLTKYNIPHTLITL